MTPSRTVVLGGERFAVETLDLPAPGKGQDAFLVADGFAGVADGSTPLVAAVDGAAVVAFAHRVLKGLMASRSADGVATVRQAVAGMDATAASVEEAVSCTVGVVRAIADGRLVAGVLGDCLVVARSAEGSISLTDDRLEPYDAKAAAAFADAIRRGADESQAREAIADLLLENRRVANTAGAYWLMTGDERVAEQWRWRDLPPEPQAILVCSDGFSRLADPLGAYAGPHELLRAAEAQGLAPLGRELREREDRPGSLVDAPRLSRYDDATAILLRRRSDGAPR